LSKKDIQLISSTISDLADYDGWAFLWDVGWLLLKKQPNFDPRNYGFQKLTPLIKSLKDFEIEQRENQNWRFKLVYVRKK
jgi:Fe-S-cluster formation regulator IscX/YfhJ